MLQWLKEFFGGTYIIKRRLSRIQWKPNTNDFSEQTLTTNSHNCGQLLVCMYVCTYECSVVGNSIGSFTLDLVAMHKHSEKLWNFFLQKQLRIKSTTKEIRFKQRSRVTNCSLKKNIHLHSCLSRTVVF